MRSAIIILAVAILGGLVVASPDPLVETHPAITSSVLTPSSTELIGVAFNTDAALGMQTTVWLSREEATGLRDRLTEALRKKE